ncbi:30S ribosomal protein S2 [Candidatus Pacearchaeota archaeon]|nr:30S ribosomal protein S2 [Candidatus Pacearchaeota archaeon]
MPRKKKTEETENMDEVKEKVNVNKLEQENTEDEVKKLEKEGRKEVNLIDKNNSEKEEKKKKFAKLLEKAKKLEASVEEAKEIDIKKKVKPEEEEVKKDALVPIEDYLKSSIHLGTRVITPDMRKFVYRRRADGLAVFNTALLDDMIRSGADFLSKFAQNEIIIVCKREAGWKAVNKFSEITGIRAYTKKYPAGILTNTNLENFTEAELIFICDPWLDKNALEDANRIGIPTLSICDTNNFTPGITQVIPGNNKSAKSLGMILYLITKIYVVTRKLSVQMPSIKEFIEGWDELQPPK